MRELDILLGRFLDAESASLSRGDWPDFEVLLECEDDRLWDWVLGETPPARFRPLISHLRSLHTG